MAEDRPLKSENIELTGRLITAVDGTQLGKGDFQSLSNMRYTDKSVQSVKGNTKINTSAITEPVVKAGMHFAKDSTSETHLIVQGLNTGGTTSSLYDHTTAIPAQGSFSSLKALSGVETGTFSQAPDGNMIFGNGTDLLIWGGFESRCAGFVVADKDDGNYANTPTIIYDYTDDIVDSVNGTYADTTQRYIHIASVRPLKGFIITITAPNTTISSIIRAYYWNSSGAWVEVSSLSDGTSVGGKPLAQSGTISFTSTETTANVRYFNNSIAYWYLIDLGVSAPHAWISKCTVDMPIQAPKDLWDGIPRTIASFQWFINADSKYTDYSPNIYATDYVEGATTTYVDLHTMTSNDYIVVGFTERMMGVQVCVQTPSGGPAWGLASVYYWNGSAWAALSGIIDNTGGSTYTTASFVQSGNIFWNQISDTLEFKTNVTTKDQYYYYKIKWTVSAPTTNPIYLDSIVGIPTQTTIDKFKFPSMFQNRLVLCNNQSDESNTALLCGSNTSSVFTGTDTIKLYFGDDKEVVGAIPFFSRFSNNFYENLVVFKSDSVWIVDGTSPEDYRAFKISSMNGCAATKTITPCDLGFASDANAGAARNVVIWQSSNSIVLWDGSSIFPIHGDISDVFDQNNSYAISLTMADKSTAFFDDNLGEWHWLWASKGNTTLNKEYVFDVLRRKWYTIDRGAGNRLQLGIPVIDSYNNKYHYGVNTLGYFQRLEYGNTFDGTAIVSSFKTGDVPLGGWSGVTSIRKLKPIVKAKNTTANSLTVNYYGDTATAVTKALTFGVSDANRRIARTTPPVQSMNEGNYVFHALECSMTTSDETCGFEPIGINLLYHDIREDIK